MINPKLYKRLPFTHVRELTPIRDIPKDELHFYIGTTFKGKLSGYLYTFVEYEDGKIIFLRLKDQVKVQAMTLQNYLFKP